MYSAIIAKGEQLIKRTPGIFRNKPEKKTERKGTVDRLCCESTSAEKDHFITKSRKQLSLKKIKLFTRHTINTIIALERWIIYLQQNILAAM